MTVALGMWAHHMTALHLYILSLQRSVTQHDVFQDGGARCVEACSIGLYPWFSCHTMPGCCVGYLADTTSWLLRSSPTRAATARI